MAGRAGPFFLGMDTIEFDSITDRRKEITTGPVRIHCHSRVQGFPAESPSTDARALIAVAEFIACGWDFAEIAACVNQRASLTSHWSRLMFQQRLCRQAGGRNTHTHTHTQSISVLRTPAAISRHRSGCPGGPHRHPLD